MPSEPKRKLVAIMFTDMVGYTSLMQKDEVKARKLIQRQREIMKPLIEKHSGTILQYVGDGTFITFDSAIEAVNCGYEIQNQFKSDKDLSLRIGIHIGDVVIDGDEVYGDGVNVASRLEPVAEPGGVCISEKVHDEIQNQPEIETVFLGEKLLKNVEHSIKIYCLTGKDLIVSKPFEEKQITPIESQELVSAEANTKPASKRLIPWAAGAAALLILFFARGWFTGESSIQDVVADENSIAVLFIENMADPSDENRNAEMVKMLLTTDLAQAKSLRVIGTQRLYDIAKQKHSGDSKLIDRSNATEIAKEARARWMLTGSFTAVGSNIILTTEIQNVKDGRILEAQRATGSDLFELVDILSREVKNALGVINVSGEIDNPVKEITTSSVEAYQYYLEGLELINEVNFSKSIEMFDKALAIDSTFTQALYEKAVAWWWERKPDPISMVRKLDPYIDDLPDKERMLIQGLDAILKYENQSSLLIFTSLVEKYPDDKQAHYSLGEVYYHYPADLLQALAAFESAIELDPGFLLAYFHVFDIYYQRGLLDRGIIEALKLQKRFPDKANGYFELVRLYSAKGEFKTAVDWANKGLAVQPNSYDLISNLAYTYQRMGYYSKAEETLNLVNGLNVSEYDLYRAKARIIGLYELQGRYQVSLELRVILYELSKGFRADIQAGALSQLAYLKFITGDTDDALKDAETAIKYSSNNPFPYITLGRIHAENGNPAGVSNTIDLIRNKNDPKEFEAVMNTVISYLNFERYVLKKEFNSAVEEYKKLKIIKYIYDTYLYKNAMVHLNMNNYESAISTASEMLKPSISPRAHGYVYPRASYIQGMAYEAQNKTSLAIESYEKLLDIWKDADEEIPERKDTIKRLAALKQGS